MDNYGAGTLNNMSGMSSGINPVTIILPKLQCDCPPGGVKPELWKRLKDLAISVGFEGFTWWPS